MASKSRGGLSAREYAAKTAGKAMPYSSVSSSKSVSSGGLKAPTAPKTGSFKFDSSKLVPQYQAEAASIYNPQIQQIQGLQALTKAQSEDAKVKTKDEFARLLKREQENINRRGAFFSGGAIDQENRIGAQEGGAIRDIGFQEQSANLQYQGTLSEIAQAQKDYVSSKVEGAYSSAYKTFQDQIANQMNQYQLELGQYNTDRNYERGVLESDRAYALSAAASARAGAGSANVYSAIDAAFKKNGGNWDATAAELAGKYDVSSGSVVDNELRRRNGLPPITAAQAAVTPNLSAGQVSALADMDATIAQAQKAKALASSVSTGPIAGRTGKAAQAIGTASDNFVDLNSQITNIKANFMKAMSGAAVSEQEVQRLSQFLPDVTDDEKVIQRKLTNLTENMNQARESLYKAASGGAYNVNQPSQMIQVYDLNGNAGQIPENEFDSTKYIKR